ncbi:MAG TPA: hypothetical protein VMA77_14260 [Solirubrobacteraceae bacterium]|nr:hypothetical protein [Solirubrobacteraceae bacterium]
MPRIRRLLPIAAAVLSTAALHAAPAFASVTQEAIFQDDNALKANPVGTMQTLRDLGVTRVRVNIAWSGIAPSPNSTRRPKGFNATNPGAYAAAGWAPYDAIDRAAAADGIGVFFTLDAPAPLWATGSGSPRGTTGYFRADWEPSAQQFGYFVKAVGTRYDGSYKPRGSTTALPRVSFWSIWNEPNYGYDLGPQGTGPHQSTPNSPRLYRGLLDAAWSALEATGHRTRTDRILFGELTPAGENSWGVFSNMKPLTFLRSLYCVDSSYHELRGSAAAAQGCPTTAAGSRNFRSQNPALFSASGFAEHPYEEITPPNDPQYLCGTKLCVGRSDPDFADLPELPRLARTLDRLNAVYGSRTHFPIWSTEYGFRTIPPDPHEGINPTTAAYYMNWAEYLSYKQARTYSYSQYGLMDPAPPAYFDTGLINPDGSLKPGFDAYRMPLYLPTTTMNSGQQVEVWGGVRPAGYARLDTGQAQSVQIQFQTGSTGPWQAIDTVPITNPKGYFDVHLAFPSSGAVRLAWTYPVGDPLLSGGTVYSRTVTITVK